MKDRLIIELQKITHRLDDVDARLEIIEARIAAQEKSNRVIRDVAAVCMQANQKCKDGEIL